MMLSRKDWTILFFRLILVLLLLVIPVRAASQPTNPPYLASFPSVEKVKQLMQVGDPRETAIRQIGAFWQLEEILKAMSGSREFRGLLPDEQRVLGAYQVAAYNIGKAIDAAYPGKYQSGITVSDYTPYRFMRTDRRFGSEGIPVFEALLTPQIHDQFNQMIGAENARHAARMKADSDAGLFAGVPAKDAQPQSNLEKEQAGIRRCAESGRSESQCMMEGLGKSFMGMVGGAMPGLNGLLEANKPRGLRMGGAYGGAGFKLGFSPEMVSLTCANLETAQYPYEVNVKGADVVIVVQTSPQPIALSLRPDGHLAGPGVVDVTGQVQVGTQYGTRTYNDGRTEPISRPVYETQTKRCNATSFAAGPAESPTSVGGLIGMLTGADKNQELPPQAPGLRFAGEYGTQSAFDMEFQDEGVVVGCRAATVLRPYSIQVGANGPVLKVQHGSSPFALSVSPDGRLIGSGTVRVDGRAVVGTNGNGELVYAPRTTSCPVGSLELAKPSN